MSDANWQKWNLETFAGGASSAVSPDLLPTNQTAWGLNVSFRGAKIETRPNIACRLVLPTGLIQGAGYFSVQGGMIVAMIKGQPFRLRIGETDFSSELISLPWYNSGVIKQIWMQQTVETLVIQDSQSNAILYNGSTAVRAGANQVPRGRMMAYGNGRLWVAINANELVAGDIRTRNAGSELQFTETNYLSGGGSLWFQKPMTGLAFIPVTGTSDYGTLLVFGRANCESVRADITQRDAWATYPGFVTNVLRSIGAASDWGLTEVNQDLFWRDGLGQLRSLRAAIQQESGPGNSSLSREVSRIVDFDSQTLLGWSSGIYFDNRFLMTASPFLNKQGGVSFKNLVSLDFAPISTMQGRSPPAYNGAWQGVNWTQLISGEFNGRIRAFGLSSDEDGINRLWEFETDEVADITISCGSGQVETEIPIESFVEYPRVDFGNPKKWKRLTRLDVWLSNIVDEITLTAYWRSDNNQRWTQWQEVVEECATMTDPATTAPHVWKNILPQQRPLIKSFSIPEDIDDISKFALANGFGFQVRLAWTGFLKVERSVLSANPIIDDPDYADRTGQEPDCVTNDVTGNEIDYTIPLFSGCPEIAVTDGSGLGSDVAFNGTVDFGQTEIGIPEDVLFAIKNTGGGPMTLGTVSVAGNAAFSILSQPVETVLFPGESTTFVVRFESAMGGVVTGAAITIPNNSINHGPFLFNLTGTVTPIAAVSYASATGDIPYTGYIDPRYMISGAEPGAKTTNSTTVNFNIAQGYSSVHRTFSGGKFYQSLQDNNVGHTPASSPLWWVECEAPLHWLSQALVGYFRWFAYTNPGGGGSHFCYRRDFQFSGGGSVNHASGTETWFGQTTINDNPAVSTPGQCIPCTIGSAISPHTNQLQVLGDYLTQSTSVVILAGGMFRSASDAFETDFSNNAPNCPGVGGATANYNVVTPCQRLFSAGEIAFNYLTPNGVLATSSAGTWSGAWTQTGCRASRATFAVSLGIPLTDYTLTVNYAASAGAVPPLNIFTFTTDINGNASVVVDIPFGVVGQTVSIASYAIAT